MRGFGIRRDFVGFGEDDRSEDYAAKLRSRYARSPELEALDPDGRLFLISLPELLGLSAWSELRELSFAASGCQGTMAARLSIKEGWRQVPNIIWRRLFGKQRAVARAVVAYVDEQRRLDKSVIGFVLGDNFYESGIPDVSDRVVDSLFEKAFVNLYNPLSEDGARTRAPFFAALGNHDHNFHDHAIVREDATHFAENLGRALAQVDYGYRQPRSGWEMPYRYYCVVSPIANFFVIDSTTLLFDTKQQEWLQRAYGALAGQDRWALLVSHHGLVTFGKRGREGAVGDASTTFPSGRVNRDIFSWLVRHGLHFHFNIAAHDHFLASAWLAYRDTLGRWRRTYHVLSGGGGAWPGSEDLETLMRLGHNLGNLDIVERGHGFATFDMTKDKARVGFRLVKGGGKRISVVQLPLELSLSKDGAWAPADMSPTSKKDVQPFLRGVIHERRGLCDFGYRRRYFEIRYGSRELLYGERPGRLERRIDLGQIDKKSRSWHSQGPSREIGIGGIDGAIEISFVTLNPERRWVFAISPEIYEDFTAWLDSG